MRNKRITIFIILFLFGASMAFLAGSWFNDSDNVGLNIDKDNLIKEADEVMRGETVNEKTEEKIAKLMFFGDFMLDRSNRTLIAKRGNDWMTEKIGELFLNQDLNILNLEGTITEKNSVSVGTKETEKGHFIFTFNPKETENFLIENKIKMVSLGNNHITNFGSEGVLETRKNLQDFEVKYFGDPQDKDNFLVQEINGIKISFVNFNAFSKINSDITIENIQKAQEQSEFVVVYTHWGAEYALMENENQKKLAHSFIDNGADLIIGTHPHVVQPVEIYKNKAIFYSLGNFIFDQYFSEDVKERLAVGVTISENKTEFFLEPLYLEKNGQLVLADEVKKKNILSRVFQNFSTEILTKNSLKEGKLSLEN